MKQERSQVGKHTKVRPFQYGTKGRGVMSNPHFNESDNEPEFPEDPDDVLDDDYGPDNDDDEGDYEDE